jgi:rsbT co-antagonist protein RsbR
MNHESTKDMSVTKNLGGGSLLGFPIYYSNGENFGTLCGLDVKPYKFTKEHLELFKTMASLLGYVIDLDMANKQIQSLSVPLVPVSEGVMVLPIIGEVEDVRAEAIIEVCLMQSYKHNLNYLIIDLSGITKFNAEVKRHLLNLVKALKLMGVTAILTGIRPELAKAVVLTHNNFEDVLVKANLQQALESIGLFTTIK